ncbi:MAG: hypothetical protein OEN01_08645 [Candidatus Krumholzibacteria bacterium]|nr:hypothetical protein [Candidatus Krumholzibacteria bacterium]
MDDITTNQRNEVRLMPAGRRLWLWWVLAGLVGCGVGGPVGVALGVPGNIIENGYMSISLGGIITGMAVTGAVMVRLLRRPLPGASSDSELATIKPLIVLLVFLLLPCHSAQAQSLDVTVAGYGLSIGNSQRVTGIRINAVDRHVEEVNGLNLTFWNPGKNSDAVYNGITLGLIGTKSRRINGVALSGIGVTGREHVRGIAAGTLGVGAGNLTGVAVGLIMVDVKERFRGINISGFWTGNSKQLDGLTLCPGGAMAQHIRGATIGGVAAGADSSLTGLGLSIGGVYSAHLRGVAVAGLGVGAEDMNGIALALGGIGGKRLDGIMLAGLGLGATERISGVAFGGVVIFAPEVNGFAAGALNGLYIDRINLEDFLHFKMANQRFTGLSIGLVNYTARLKGVQLGLLNFAGNNPRWLRLLPLVNVHL